MMPSELSPGDEAAIRERVRAMTLAWERGDGAGYAAVCTGDARYVTASGTRLRGRAEIAEAHQVVFDGPMRGTTLELDDVMDLQAVAPGVVLVQATGAVRFPAQDGASPRSAGVLSLVAVPEDGGWRFASFCNVPIAPQSRV